MGDVDIKHVRDIHPIKIQEVSGIEPINIDRVQNIGPIAAHIKEVNHIDPILVDALHVTEIKNIEPINVQKFNVTNLPMVNVSLHQLPAVNMNVRRLPPVSVGTHQNFHIPSNYTVRARFLGIEFFRVHLNGHTIVVPTERYRREQGRTQNRSFPLTATAGNPAIPFTRHEKSVTVYYPATGCRSRPMHRPRHGHYVKNIAPSQAASSRRRRRRRNPISTTLKYPNKTSSLYFGLPAVNFHISEPEPSGAYGGSSVSSGG